MITRRLTENKCAKCGENTTILRLKSPFIDDLMEDCTNEKCANYRDSARVLINRESQIAAAEEYESTKDDNL